MLLKLISAIALPVLVFFGGATLMFSLSDRDLVVEQLNAAELEDRVPLYQRRYDAEAASRHWGVLKTDALNAERLFLKLDLVFPLLCSAALSVSLLMLGELLAWPHQRFWLVIPALVILVADWTENVIQLSQLNLFIEGGKEALEVSWLEFASAATSVKLAFSAGSLLLVIVLSVCSIVRLIGPNRTESPNG